MLTPVGWGEGPLPLVTTIWKPLYTYICSCFCFPVISSDRKYKETMPLMKLYFGLKSVMLCSAL